ncbi:MAG TPA: MarP family serine protease [Kineosporiaceae bacterium]|nr:MarP family serine protease [Kineosporiaceae bacterium]
MTDLVVLIVMAWYAISGYRQGLVVGALSLCGFLGGALVAMFLVPVLTQGLQPGLQRSFLVLVAVLLLAWIGQLLGAMLGGKVREQLTFPPVQVVDQLLGAIAGLVSVALVLWFVGGALRASPSPSVARAVASSRVLAGVDRVIPDRLTTLANSFREAVAGSSFPRVFAGVGPEQILRVPAPDPGAMPSVTLHQAQRSLVKITGEARACSRGQEGSGFVVAPERVATNAHVVAGVRSPSVQVMGVGRHYDATVVLFDPRRDIAVLAVPGLKAPALRLGDDQGNGEDAVVAGFPRNGPFSSSPARVRSVIQASGEDIYGQPGVTRQVYSLYAVVEPGNSGGPLLAVDGSVAGIVFAKSLDDPQTGYALTLSESRADLVAGSTASAQVGTGGCAVG